MAPSACSSSCGPSRKRPPPKLIFPDALILPDIRIHILSQLNPHVRADRYALLSCLPVSRTYFHLAAARLWSSLILPTVPTHDASDPCKILLDHVLANEPGGEGGRDARRAGRIALYLRSIRAIECYRSDPDLPPHRLLPWLGRLDWVDATRLEDGWVETLLDRFSAPGQRPRHLRLSSSPDDGGVVLMERFAGSLKSLEIASSGGLEDGELAAFVTGLTGRRRDEGVLEALEFPCLQGVADMEALEDCLIANGATLRNVGILDYNLPMGAAMMRLDYVTSSVCRLTRLSMRIGRDDAMAALASALLTANAATLTDVRFTNLKTALDLTPLPLSDLRVLRSLTLDELRTLDKEIRNVPFECLPRLSGLHVSAHDWHQDGLKAFMGKANGLQLRDLSVNLFRCRSPSSQCGEVQIRLRGLRSVSLAWASSASLALVDWKEIEADGLPMLEEIEVQVGTPNPCSPGRSGARTLLEVVCGALVSERRAPTLAYANSYIELHKY
ncbi:hypothetical protein HK101_003317 [Irineochytrium annulatum]|nr:hypothetical protein HK101_003317 [Irineochytrium annulatum]